MIINVYKLLSILLSLGYSEPKVIPPTKEARNDEVANYPEVTGDQEILLLRADRLLQPICQNVSRQPLYKGKVSYTYHNVPTELLDHTTGKNRGHGGKDIPCYYSVRENRELGNLLFGK